METKKEESPVKTDNGIDMLNGSLGKKLLIFALPIALSSMLQQLFNSADVAVVGRFAEEGAMAAVGSNSVLVGLLVNVFMGLSVGTNVVISHYIGQGREKEAGKVVHTSMLFALLCGIAMMLVGIAFSRPVLIMMDAPADVLDRAVLYLRIYCVGMPFIIPYNFGSSILRSIGDTKRPMYCLIISGIINLCLNLVFVIGCGMGVAGVAIATVVSNIFSATAVILILTRQEGAIHLDIKQLSFDKGAIKRVLKIGAPAALQSAVFSLSNICLQTAINSFGSKAVAGMTAAINFEMFSFFVTNAFSQTAVTFVGQNYGAGKFDRCKKILRLCLLEGILGTLVLSTLFFLGKDFLVRIYTVDPAEIEYALIRMKYIAPLVFIAGSYEITGSALRGMGRSSVPAFLTVIGSVVFRVMWVYTVFARFKTIFSLLIVYPLTWGLTGAMVVGYYFAVRKKVYGRAL